MKSLENIFSKPPLPRAERIKVRVNHAATLPDVSGLWNDSSSLFSSLMVLT